MFLTVFVNWLCKKLINRFATTDYFWDDALIEAVRKPLLLLIWMTAIIFIIEHAVSILKFESIGLIKSGRSIVIILAISWFFFGLIKQIEKFWLTRFKTRKSKLDPTTIGALSKVMNITLLVLTGLATMQSMGFSVGAVLAFVGGGGIAAGFAAKDFLANFFGAVMIYMDKPFKVGDWIRSPDKEIEGYVENISFRATMIRTLDKRPLYVPNSVFNTISIENPSRMSHRRIMETVGLRHEDYEVITNISKEAEKMLRSHKAIDSTLPVIINLNDVSTTSLNITLMAFTKIVETEDFYKLKQEILLKLLKIIHKNEAKIAQLPSNIMSE